MCMEMRKNGVPWVPLDFYGNGNKISHGMEVGIKTWVKKTLHIVTSKHLQQCLYCVSAVA